MRDALVADLKAVPDLIVTDDRPDLAIVIAPETAGILEERIAFFRKKCPVIAPDPNALALTCDKLQLAHHWQKHGVPTPSTALANQWSQDRVPCVIKPRDGAGSVDTRLITSPADFEAVALDESRIAQDFLPGRAASITFLIGPNRTVSLPPTFQRLSSDGEFRYLGGDYPLPIPLARRAQMIGERAIQSIDGLRGYIGVDLVLGDAEDGSEDFAIEINPRWTTSYIGLRRAIRVSLAGILIKLIQGEVVGNPQWIDAPVSFDSDGNVFNSKR